MSDEHERLPTVKELSNKLLHARIAELEALVASRDDRVDELEALVRTVHEAFVEGFAAGESDYPKYGVNWYWRNSGRGAVNE